MQVSHIKSLRRILIGLIIMVVVAVVFNYIQTWRRRARILTKTAKILSTELVRSAESIEYSEHEQGVVRFKIRAEKLLETRQGKNLLQGIQAFDFNPDGSIRNQIRSQRAEYDRDHKTALFSGDVRLRIGQGVELRTDSLDYDLGANLGKTEGRVQVFSDQVSGTARGVDYEHGKKILNLHRELNFVLRRTLRDQGSASKNQTVHVTSNQGFFNEGARILRFQGNAHLESEVDLLSGGVIEVTFNNETKQITSLSCEGAANYDSKDEANPRTMQGDRMVFGLDRASGALERIDILRRAVFSSRSENSVQELRASQIHLGLDAAKGLPKRIEGQDQVQFRIRRESQDIFLTGEHLEADFVAGSGGLERLRVWERARMLTRADAESGTDELQAGEIRIFFREVQGRTAPRELQAEKPVQWQMAPKTSKPGDTSRQGRVLTADELKMFYAENGDYLEAGKAKGRVTITGIPIGDSSQTEIRRLEAETVQFHFYPVENRLKDFEAEKHVSVFFHKPPDVALQRSSEEFRTTSSNMRCSFRQQDGTAETFSQSGNFVYQDSNRKATAGRCDYGADTEVLVLRDTPKIIDDTGSSTGEWIEYDRKKHVLTIHHRVQTTLKPKEGEQGTPFGSSSNAGSPSVITADLMQYWDADSRARYSGTVLLLSEDGQLQARALEIHNNGERVEAEGGIRHLVIRPKETNTPRAGSDSKPNARRQEKGDQQASQAVICSDQMRYLKEQNSIHYTGKVVLTSEDTWMSSESLDAILSADGKSVERAAARGGVLTRQAGRVARGDLADYYLAPGKFVVTGHPAEIMIPARGKSQAHRLTFFTTDDRVLIENR